MQLHTAFTLTLTLTLTLLTLPTLATLPKCNSPVTTLDVGLYSSTQSPVLDMYSAGSDSLRPISTGRNVAKLLAPVGSAPGATTLAFLNSNMDTLLLPSILHDGTWVSPAHPPLPLNTTGKVVTAFTTQIVLPTHLGGDTLPDLVMAVRTAPISSGTTQILIFPAQSYSPTTGYTFSSSAASLFLTGSAAETFNTYEATIAVGDLNGDSPFAHDLVVAVPPSAGGPGVVIYPNDFASFPSTGFSPNPLPIISIPAGIATDLTLLDANGDGVLDLAWMFRDRTSPASVVTHTIVLPGPDWDYTATRDAAQGAATQAGLPADTLFPLHSQTGSSQTTHQHLLRPTRILPSSTADDLFISLGSGTGLALLPSSTIVASAFPPISAPVTAAPHVISIRALNVFSYGSIDIADWDGDGDMDILYSAREFSAGTSYDGSFFLVTSSPSLSDPTLPQFSSTEPISVHNQGGFQSSPVFVGLLLDLDQDGGAHDALVLHDRNSGQRLQAFVRDPTVPTPLAWGTPEETATLSAGETILGVDMDTDGLLDLVVQSESGITTLTGLGNGDFSQGETHPLPIGSPYGIGSSRGTSFQVSDLDHDGILDMVFVSTEDRDFFVVYGIVSASGTHLFDVDNSLLLLYNDASGESYEIHLADVDGDGYLDILARGANHQFLVIYNPGPLRMSWETIVLDIPFTYNGWIYSVLPFEANDDIYSDIVILYESGIYILYGEQTRFDPTSPPTPHHFHTVVQWQSWSAAAGDISGDGAMDYVHYFSNSFYIYFAVPGPNLTMVSVPNSIPSAGYALDFLDVVDLDPTVPGKDLVFLRSGSQNLVGLVVNVGPNTQFVTHTVTTPSDPSSLAMVDVNSDGFLDIAYTSLTGSSYVLLQAPVRFFPRAPLDPLVLSTHWKTTTAGTVLALHAQLASVSPCQAEREVWLDPGTYSTCSSASMLGITGSVVLRPNPSAPPGSRIVLDCSSHGGVLFHVRDGGSLTLIDVDIVGATSLPTQIDTSSPLQVSGSGSVLTLISSTISSCSANPNTGALLQSFAGRGGAVLVRNSGSLVLSQGSSLFSNYASLSGGAVHVAFSGTLLVSSSQMTANTAGADGGGALSVSALGSAAFTSATLSQNSAGGPGGAISFASDDATLTLQDSTLTANTGSHGGAVCATSGTIQFLGSTVLSSNSAHWGGAIAAAPVSLLPVTTSPSAAIPPASSFTGPPSSRPTLSFGSATSLTANAASRYGGALFACSIALDLGTTSVSTWSLNKAARAGPSLFLCNDPVLASLVTPVFVSRERGSPPVALTLLHPELGSTISAPAGVGIGGSVLALDVFGDIVEDPTVTLEASLVAPSTPTLALDDAVHINSGGTVGFSAGSTKVVDLPSNLPQDVSISFTVVDSPPSAGMSATLAVTVTTCPPTLGGIVDQATGTLVCAPCSLGTASSVLSAEPCQALVCAGNQVISSNNTCVCKAGFWKGSVASDGSGDCVACPTGGLCEQGLGTPSATPGFFASSGGSAGIVFSPCPNPNACSGNNICASGYSGYLCIDCQNGYFRSKLDTCDACPSSPGLLLLVLAFLILLAAAAILAVAARIAAKRSSRVAHSTSERRQPRSSEKTKSEGAPRLSFKALAMGIMFVQIASLLERANFSWSSSSRSVLNVFSILNVNLSILAPSCTLEGGFYGQYRLALAVPLAVLFVIILFGLVVGLVKHQGAPLGALMFVVHAVRVAVVAGGPIVYVALSFNTLQLFDCRTLPSGDIVLDNEKSLDCFDAEWMSHLFVGLAGVVVYVIGIPGILFAALYRSRSTLSDPHTLAKYGSLFTHVRRPFYLLEVGMLVLRLVAVSGVAFLDAYPVWQLLSLLLLFAGAAVVQWKKAPYVQFYHNRLQVCLLFGICFVCVCGALSMLETSASASAKVATLGLVLTIIACGLGITAYTMFLEAKYRRRKTKSAFFFGASSAFGIDGIEVDANDPELIRIWAPNRDAFTSVVTALQVHASDHNLAVIPSAVPSDCDLASSLASSLSDCDHTSSDCGLAPSDSGLASSNSGLASSDHPGSDSSY